MIIEFSVSNFRSIYDKVTLSMVAAKLTGKENTQDNIFEVERYKNLPLLKTAAIYGANAAGKSNLLKGISFFKEFLLNSTDLKLGANINIIPFKLFEKAKDEPLTFEMDFIAVDGIRYIYGFSITESEVTEERLVSFSTNKPTEIFVRKKRDPIKFSSILKGHKKILEEQLQNNHLFLTKAANSNFEQLIPVYLYFKDTLKIYLENTSKSLHTNLHSVDNLKFQAKVVELLKIADTGISSMSVKSSKVIITENRNVDFNELFQTFVGHFTTDIEIQKPILWELSNESDGTIKLFNFAAPIFVAIENGSVLIIDELNNSWHPLITEYIINLFNNKETNPKNAQLIFTTHDSSLLSKNLFRRDQMWFFEKDKRGMSKLFSLTDFDKKGVRWNIPFDKWYLSGRFGAIPNIQKFNSTVNEEAVPSK